MKKKGNKKMPTPRQITPSLHLCFAPTCCFVYCKCIRQKTSGNIVFTVRRNKDVGMGL